MLVNLKLFFPTPRLQRILQAMKSHARLAVRLAKARPLLAPSHAILPRHIHNTSASPATVTSTHGQGPPPEAPTPAADSNTVRLARRKKQASLLKNAQDIRAAQKAPKASSTHTPLRRRFWKDVQVKEVHGALEVHLDTRPLRHPATKNIVRLPLSKPLLANALALEWDTLVSVQQASKEHLIPLTSLTCRAIDIAEDDAAAGNIRTSIVTTVMRYLDTDTVLCWAPPPGKYDYVEGQQTLRERQQKSAEAIVGFLSTRVWPGTEIVPILDGESLMPRPQSPATLQIIKGWIAGLSAWELAGFERSVLAGKSVLNAARLVIEWSEDFAGTAVIDGATGGDEKFGIEEAATAASIEVDWQVGNWGEVEDSHDVEKEDIRRQLGGVVLLVSGTNKK